MDTYDSRINLIFQQRSQLPLISSKGFILKPIVHSEARDFRVWKNAEDNGLYRVLRKTIALLFVLRIYDAYCICVCDQYNRETNT